MNPVLGIISLRHVDANRLFNLLPIACGNWKKPFETVYVAGIPRFCGYVTEWTITNNYSCNALEMSQPLISLLSPRNMKSPRTSNPSKASNSPRTYSHCKYVIRHATHVVAFMSEKDTEFNALLDQEKENNKKRVFEIILPLK